MKLVAQKVATLSRQCQKQLPRATTTYQSQRNATNLTRPAVEADAKSRSLAYQLRRDWKVGDVYAPHDMSPAEMRKWAKKKSPDKDVFDILAVDPLSLYKNVSVMTDFVSETGRIRPRSETGLRPVNQRKIAKAIRRAIALGIMPSAYKHPMLIKSEKDRKTVAH
ncbi:37S ribosomal protein rsm18, mitochondrial [Cyphellophora attinorum]|uniref:Small ribosomal subunit protein bS18m n=1 Tax=Cyphellophora attinorum TaxID=1664694 RepID=A0A0N1HBU2_9EURO|nr:37S ribosomal protein rsm18, mitochondrial [Phialophora attinorum]KPI45750.1 37S ribosomal protein rsm18, mitochondrial [Phialophora attinorum]